MPNLEGFEHGNLPELKEANPETRQAADKTVLAQHPWAPLRLVRLNNSGEIAATRVDVDAHGRRMLINHMR